MKHWRNINFWRILKIMCIVLCAVFLFAACDDEGGQIGPSDKKETIDAQRNCYMEVDATTGASKTICPADDTASSGGAASGVAHDCLPASIIKMFYGGLGKMASSVYGKITSENLLSLMVLAFSIWMAFQILKHISTTSPESLGEFWTKILRKATLCVACGILASTPENIYYAVNTFVFPIYITLLEFASSVLEILSKDPASQLDKIVIEGDLGSELSSDGNLTEPITHHIDGACKITDSASIQISNNKFPQGPADMMGCMACVVSDRLSVGYTIAYLTMKSPGLLMTLVSILIFCVFTFVKWGFILYLVDSVFRLTMMITIMPFLILFFPFEQTRKWTTSGFKIILNSAAIMLCLAMLVGITIFAMDEVIKNNNFGDKSAYVKFGATPLTLMFMAFVMTKVTGLAVSLSDNVTGGGGSARFQEKLTQIVGRLAQAGWLIITFGAGVGATAAMEHSKRIRTAVEKAQKVAGKISKVKAKMDRMAGRSKQGGGKQAW